MKITAIKAQVKRAARYSVFVDEAYSFSLSEDTLLDQRLVVGQELDASAIANLHQLSDDDKMYNRAINYLAIRVRSQWEMEQYLTRKESSQPLIESIVSKLTKLNLLNDATFAEAFVRDRQMVRPTSTRMLLVELRKRHIASDIISSVLSTLEVDDRKSIHEVIMKKRRQSKYVDTTKLMQYLARQGYQYGAIKAALQVEDDQ
jgi:regulatory protein